MINNWIKSLFKPKRSRLIKTTSRSLFLLTLLFILSVAIPPVIATISTPNLSIAQTRSNNTQLVDRAKQSYLQGQFEDAASLWEKTVTLYGDRGDKLNQAMALSNLSLTYQQLGQWNKAQKSIQDSLELLKTQSEKPEKQTILAQSLDIQGQLQREMGRSADALNSWQQASEVYQKINNKEQLAQSKINQAQSMQDLGLYPRACKTLLEVLDKEIGVLPNIECKSN
jgi:tetratricopeptide (TPR) repeat protein